jgi:hypothetical protein
VTKQQLAAELGRSTRWIEQRVNEGMPVESSNDRHGRRLFDLDQSSLAIRTAVASSRRSMATQTMGGLLTASAWRCPASGLSRTMVTDCATLSQRRRLMPEPARGFAVLRDSFTRRLHSES